LFKDSWVVKEEEANIAMYIYRRIKTTATLEGNQTDLIIEIEDVTKMLSFKYDQNEKFSKVYNIRLLEQEANNLIINSLTFTINTYSSNLIEKLIDVYRKLQSKLSVVWR
jgi:hypothetical protein